MTDEHEAEITEMAEAIVHRLINSTGESWCDIMEDELRTLLADRYKI